MIAPGRSEPRIAVILPVRYFGGTVRLTLNVVRHLAAQDAVKVVFGVPAEHLPAIEDEVAALRAECPHVEVRGFRWRCLDRDTAACYATAAGVDVGVSISTTYQIPVDSGVSFCDCDFWFFVSDRLEHPLVPLRPYGVLVTDHLQRYVPDIFEPAMYRSPDGAPWNFLRAVRNADVVVATSADTARDAVTYAGALGRVVRMPTTIDIDHFLRLAASPTAMTEHAAAEPYFVWVTNSSRHKNHLRMLRALKHYYEALGGGLDVVVTGLWTDLFDPDLPAERIGDRRAVWDYPYVREVRETTRTLLADRRQRIHFRGSVSDAEYVRTVRGARFLLHNVLADNGTYSVVEAAILGRPAISSDYPQMREIDRGFSLGLRFFDACDPVATARALRDGESLPASVTTASDVEAAIHRRSWRSWDDSILTAIRSAIAAPRRPVAFL
ncbi:MAG: hypothetical protein ACOYK7_08665 [Pirellulales bacterium]